jgi:hypothetical protein
MMYYYRGAQTTAKFSTVLHNICGFSASNLFHVTLLASKISGWLPCFFKFVYPCHIALYMVKDHKTV